MIQLQSTFEQVLLMPYATLEYLNVLRQESRGLGLGNSARVPTRIVGICTCLWVYKHLSDRGAAFVSLTYFALTRFTSLTCRNDKGFLEHTEQQNEVSRYKLRTSQDEGYSHSPRCCCGGHGAGHCRR